jgi:hypothetical protein
MRRERQLKKIRQKESLDLLVMKRVIKLLLCTLMRRFSLFLYVVKERFPCHIQVQANLLVPVGMEINLDHLPHDLIHVAGLGGEDVSVCANCNVSC